MQECQGLDKITKYLIKKNLVPHIFCSNGLFLLGMDIDMKKKGCKGHTPALMLHFALLLS